MERMLYQHHISFVLNQQIYPSNYIQILNNRARVVTERIRMWIQAAKIDSLCRVAWISLRDKVRSLHIWMELAVQSHRWLAHLIMMFPGCLPLVLEVFWSHPTERRPLGRPRTLPEENLIWPGNVVGYARKNWKSQLGRVMSGIFLLLCCTKQETQVMARVIPLICNVTVLLTNKPSWSELRLSGTEMVADSMCCHTAHERKHNFYRSLCKTHYH